jgi:hypothetical protein
MWHHDRHAWRVTISVDGKGWARRDRVAEVDLDFSAILAATSPRRPLNPASLRLVEVDETGPRADEAVPFQFDRADDWHPLWNAHGTLAFLLAGDTPPDGVRRFHLYFDADPSIAPCTTVPMVETREVHAHGSPHLEIRCPNARWLFDLTGGGFSELRDRDEGDWIQFDDAGPPIEYRGIPNLQVYYGPGRYKGVFHPGYGTVRCRVLSRGPLAVRIRCEAFVHAAWECTWDVFPESARCTVHRGAGIGFAFLYEGVPGGRDFNTTTAYVVESDGCRSHFIPSGNKELWRHNITPKWVVFGDERVDRSLFYAHHEEDGIGEAMYEVFDALTVWGFGRNQLPGIHQYPARFTVGLCESSAYDAAAAAVNSAYRELDICVGPLEVAPAGTGP